MTHVIITTGGYYSYHIWVDGSLTERAALREARATLRRRWRVGRLPNGTRASIAIPC